MEGGKGSDRILRGAPTSEKQERVNGCDLHTRLQGCRIYFLHLGVVRSYSSRFSLTLRTDFKNNN